MLAWHTGEVSAALVPAVARRQTPEELAMDPGSAATTRMAEIGGLLSFTPKA
jgi:hypothetical protein